MKFSPGLFLILVFAGCATQNFSTGQVTLDNAAKYDIQKIVFELKTKYQKSEEPTLTVIENVDDLKARQFAIFGEAEDGMLLIVWQDLLVIYDPKSSSIVNELSISNFGG